MKLYIIYDAAGNILKSGQCSTAKFERLRKEGERIIEGVGNDIEHKVVNGKIQSKESIPEVVPSINYFPALISQQQWEEVLARLDKLES